MEEQVARLQEENAGLKKRGKRGMGVREERERERESVGDRAGNEVGNAA